MPYAHPVAYAHPKRPWYWWLWNVKPHHEGTLVLIQTHEAHLAKKLSRTGKHNSAAHEAFWSFATIPLTTVAGITIGKLIERRKKA
jgi:hypothetical protein